MIILGIETSCDETALSLIEIIDSAHEAGQESQPKFKVLSSVVHSQIAAHAPYGGVFPSLAKREHSRNLPIALEKLFEDATSLDSKSKIQDQTLTDGQRLEITKILEREEGLAEALISLLPRLRRPQLGAIAVTAGPGLEPALWVGINFAKALSLAWNVPIIPVNHMEGHVVASLLKEPSFENYSHLSPLDFPALALLISGGHTELVSFRDWRKYKIIGQTKDDAVGEAYDKVARILGLPYPGGPEISALAQKWRTLNVGSKNGLKKENDKDDISLPRPMIQSGDYNFSFAGLKTAVLYIVKKMVVSDLTEQKKMQIAHEFEEAVADVLIAKTELALESMNARTLIIGGGVIANTYLREKFAVLAKKYDVAFYVPLKNLSTDNAIMIALAGYFIFKMNPESVKKDHLEAEAIIAEGTMSL